MKCADLVDYKPGNHGLTEETTYNQTPASPDEAVPIFSGSRDNTTPIGYVAKKARNKAGEPIEYFRGPCIILTKDGSAGLLTYKGEGEFFTINHHACILTAKPEWEDGLDLGWFALQFQTRFSQVATSQSDNQVFSIEWLHRLEVSIPGKPVQERQRRKKDAVRAVKKTLRDAREKAIELLRHPVRLSGKTQSVLVSDLFVARSGNSGLTEQVIYEQQPLTAEDGIPILTAATQEQNQMGVISRNAVLPNGRKLRIFSKPGIIVTRNGYAGTLQRVGGGLFTMNDHAYFLEVRREWEEQLNLQWFVHQCQPMFWQTVSSRSDNATFNKGWLGKITVELPSKPAQDAIASKVTRLRDFIERSHRLERRIDSLLSLPIED